MGVIAAQRERDDALRQLPSARCRKPRVPGSGSESMSASWDQIQGARRPSTPEIGGAKAIFAHRLRTVLISLTAQGDLTNGQQSDPFTLTLASAPVHRVPSASLSAHVSCMWKAPGQAGVLPRLQSTG
jgi:hypothetical protein